MRLLVDAQLPPALARWLGDHGLSAAAVRQSGLRDADDGSIWRFAVKGGWTVVKKDEDLAARCIADAMGPSIVWLRKGNCTNQDRFGWLVPFPPDIQDRLNRGEELIEVR